MAKKRGATYFGVYLPPFKEEKMGAGTTTIRFVVKGSVISKKNNELTVTKTRDALDFLDWKKDHAEMVKIEDAILAVKMVESVFVGNKQYGKFLREQMPVIEAQKAFWVKQLGHKGLAFPLQNKATMNIRMYFKGRYIQDAVNKQQTIQDLLVECDVLADDDYQVVNPIHTSAACFHEEIMHNLIFISLSFRLDEKNKSEKIKQRIEQKEQKRQRKVDKMTIE